MVTKRGKGRKGKKRKNKSKRKPKKKPDRAVKQDKTTKIIVFSFIILLVFSSFIYLYLNKTTITVNDINGNKINARLFLYGKLGIPRKGVNDYVIRFNDMPLKEIILFKANSSTLSNIVVGNFSKKIGVGGVGKGYIIDLSNVNFSNGFIYSIANGRMVVKCKRFTNKCVSGWKEVMKIVPGKPYKFNINKEDPVFAEIYGYWFDDFNDSNGIYNSNFVDVNNSKLSLSKLGIFYNESDSESTTNSTSYVDNLQLSLNKGTYVIIASGLMTTCCLDNSISVRATIDGVTYMENQFMPRGSVTENYYPFSFIKYVNLSLGNHVVKIQYNSSNGEIVKIKDVRIIALPLNADYCESNSVSTTTSQTPSTKCSLNHDGLFLVGADFSGSSTYYSPVIRFGDSNVYGLSEREPTYPLHYLGFSTMGIINGLEKLEYSSEYPLETTYVRNARIIGINLSDISGYFYNESDSESKTESTTYVDKVDLNFVPNEGNYLVIGSCFVKQEDTGYSVYSDMLIDDNDVGEMVYRPKDGTDYIPFFIIKKVFLNDSQHTIKIRYRTSSSGYGRDAYIKYARIIAIPLDRYFSDGNITSIDINPVSISRWNRFNSSYYKTNYSDIKFALILGNGTNYISNGDISWVNDGSLRLFAELSTTNNTYGSWINWWNVSWIPNNAPYKPLILSIEGKGNNSFINVSDPKIRFKVIDDEDNIINCSLVVNGSILDEMQVNNNTESYFQNNLSNGNYNFYINCTDNPLKGPLSNYSDIWHFSIDTKKPEIKDVIYNSSINLGESFKIKVNVSDDNLDSVWVTFSNKIYLGYNSTSGFYEGLIYVPLNQSSGNNIFYVYVNDSAGNTNFSQENVYVNDRIKPNIVLISPSDNNITDNETIDFIFNVSDYGSGVDKCSLILDNMILKTINASSGKNEIIENLSDGLYKWKIMCYDHFNNINYSGERNLNVSLPKVLVNLSVQDSNKYNVNISGIFINNGKIKYKSIGKGVVTNIPKGKYDVVISTNDKNITNPIDIRFKSFDIKGNVSKIVDIDDISDIELYNKDRIYAINKYVNESAIVETSSRGSALYKCSDWNFTERRCYGSWRRIKKLVPGKRYKFLLSNNDPAYGESSNVLTLKTITIDGNFDDWDSVLANPKNVVTDGVSGEGDADNVSSSDKDLTDFAFTWDENNLYFYFKRVSASSFLSSASVLVYIDKDRDGYMNSTDKVVKFVWKSSSLTGYTYDSYLYNYVPSSDNGDLIQGDGHTMPGTLTNETTLETNVDGVDSNGIKLESKVPWSYIGNAGIPLYMHVSSAKSTGTNIPSDIEDNMNRVDTLIVDVSITPDRESSSIPGGNVLYNHTIKNLGNKKDVVDMNTTATRPGWNVSLHYTNGTLISDSDSDGIPDVVLDPDQSVNIIVNISIPSNESDGVEDNTVVWATSSLNTGISDSVIDTTSIGDIIIIPDRTGYIVANKSIIYNHSVYNNQGINDVFEIYLNSTQNWNATFYINGVKLNDSDSDGYIDFNISANSEKTLVVNISAPSVGVGTIDYSTIKVFSKNDTSKYDNVIDKTTIANRIEVEPDYSRRVGVGDFTFYKHTIRNSWDSSDVIDITTSSTKNWNITLYDSDKKTELNDSDSDGIPDVSLGSFGDQKIIYLKLNIPDTASENDTDITTVYGNSSISNAYDTAIDNTTVKILLTYNDSARTSQTDYFKRNQTVYAKATGLTSGLGVYFVWINPNSTIVNTSSDKTTDSEGKAYDDFYLNDTALPGKWTLILYRSFNDREITRHYFYLRLPPNVTVIRPNGSEIFSGNETINWTANSPDNDELNFTIQYSPDNGTTWFNIAENLPNGTTNYTWDTTSTYDGNLYLIKVIAYDWFQSNYDVSDSVFTIDNTGPTIQWVNATPNPVDPGNTINITAKVTDNVGVDTVVVEINGQNHTMNYSGNDIYYYDGFDTFIEAGTYNYTIYANDTKNNPANPVESNFSVNALVSITVSNATIDFGNVYSGETKDAINNPIVVKNNGNVNEMIKVKGSDLTGLQNNSYIINVTNVHYSINSSFVNETILNYTYKNITNISMGGNVSVYFRLYSPLYIISQNYTGNVEFFAVQG